MLVNEGNVGELLQALRHDVQRGFGARSDQVFADYHIVGRESTGFPHPEEEETSAAAAVRVV